MACWFCNPARREGDGERALETVIAICSERWSEKTIAMVRTVPSLFEGVTPAQIAEMLDAVQKRLHGRKQRGRARPPKNVVNLSERRAQAGR